MNYFSDPSLSTSYQFSRWSPSLIRPPGNKSDKNTLKSTSNQQCSSFIESRSHSPPLLYQPAPTPDLYVIDEQSSSVSSITPVRIKSATLTIPLKTNSEEIILTNFAKQSHERRKLALERKLRKQQVQKYAHMDSDIWFHLRQSSIPLKRLTKTDEGQNTLQQLPINCEKLEQNEKKSDFKSTPILRPRTSIPKSSTSASQTLLKPILDQLFNLFSSLLNHFIHYS
ncbi:hypothetical protein I4U23_017534 [Adineta vaga]|nr:hypothetical protein I4U23_017534 [Adineta vaga]